MARVIVKQVVWLELRSGGTGYTIYAGIGDIAVKQMRTTSLQTAETIQARVHALFGPRGSLRIWRSNGYLLRMAISPYRSPSRDIVIRYVPGRGFLFPQEEKDVRHSYDF